MYILSGKLRIGSLQKIKTRLKFCTGKVDLCLILFNDSVTQ